MDESSHGGSVTSEAEVVEVPVLPLRDVVVYPHGVHPLFVGTKASIVALDAAMGADKRILLVARRDGARDDPGAADLFEVGTLAVVLQLLKLPDGTVKILVEGGQRARILRLADNGRHLVAEVEAQAEARLPVKARQALTRTMMKKFEACTQGPGKWPKEAIASISAIDDDPARLIDAIAAALDVKVDERQAVLEAFDLEARMQRVIDLMEKEVALHQVQKSIHGRVKKQMEKSQREYYLNEQMKAIQRELGSLDDVPNELDELARKVVAAKMPKEARGKAEGELSKLKLMAPMSPEATVVRAYLDWLVSIPWSKRRRVRRNLETAQRILDEDHYGLEEVKERIVEYLAVQGRVNKLKGPVLCLVGPPGVGKTSLGESIARATHRKFVRMALGGVRDEAEIRGHRRTYIGALPGKVLQKMAKAGVRNPLFLFDEVDKMGMDVRGDPASALLEVLDPEQNNTFNDHYLEVDYDLSDVFFVCTSNSMNVPPPLLDRMEVIRLPGYTEDEKVNIALRYLAPKQKTLNGLAAADLDFSDAAILHLIRYYTKEAGVRGLEREIAKLCRKVVRDHALKTPDVPVAVSPEVIEHYNGVRKFDYGRAEERNQVGIVTGLAWTQAGGELLNIEAVAVPGKGQRTLTGSLGEVMKESIHAALTFVRSRAEVLGIAPNFHEKLDLHVHVPEGATRKDGPSAGIGMCTALVSVLTGIPVQADIAMTGEITLRGQVLSVGGLKEKLLAARRGGVRRVVIPADNERDLKEVPDNIKADLTITPVKWMDDIIDIALERRPAPLKEAAAGAPAATAEQGVAIAPH